MSGAGSFFLMEVSVILLVSQSCHEFLSQYSRDFSVWESSSPWRGLALPFPYILEWLVFLGFSLAVSLAKKMGYSMSKSVDFSKELCRKCIAMKTPCTGLLGIPIE